MLCTLIFQFALAGPTVWGGTDYFADKMTSDKRAACNTAKACYTNMAICAVTFMLPPLFAFSPFCIFTDLCIAEMGAHPELAHAADGYTNASDCFNIRDPDPITYCSRVGDNVAITSPSLAAVCCKPSPDQSQPNPSATDLPDCKKDPDPGAQAEVKFAQALKGLSSAFSGSMEGALSLLSDNAAATPSVLKGMASAVNGDGVTVKSGEKKNNATGNPLSMPIPKVGGDSSGKTNASGFSGDGSAASGGGATTPSGDLKAASAPQQLASEEGGGLYDSGGGSGGPSRSLARSFSGSIGKGAAASAEFGAGDRSTDSKVMKGEDPEDYFTRIDLNESLFKKVSVSYMKIATSWELKIAK